MENATVKEVLKTIERKSDYSFFWNSSDFDSGRIVSINKSDCSIPEIIAEILPGFECRVEKKKIILVKAARSEVPGADDKRGSTISGVVCDGNGEPLPGAVLVLRMDSRDFACMTDNDGRYRLERPSVPLADATLKASFLGFGEST
ncbi:MAG: carboxypeptidase-like regulatory domain-containing protein, partial [Candidatus Cryptobacteroides sp.]